MAKYFTDFSEHAIGAQPTGWTRADAGAALQADWKVTADALAIGGVVLRLKPVTPFNGSNTSLLVALAWTALGIPVGACEVVCFYRFNGPPGSTSRTVAPLRIHKKTALNYSSYIAEHRFNGSRYIIEESVGSANGGASTRADLASSAASAPAANTWYGMRFRWEPSTGTLSLKHWVKTGAADFGEPVGWDVTVVDASPETAAYLAIGGNVTTFNSGEFGTADTVDFDVVGAATAGETAPLAGAPATPSVTISETTKSTAELTGDAFSQVGSATHAYTKVRVRRVSDDAILYGPETITDPLLGPHLTSGLPTGPSGPRFGPVVDPDLVGELLYGNSDGFESDWGTSDAFQTLGLWESGEFDCHFRFCVANGSGTLIGLDGRYISGQVVFPNPNAPIGGMTITLLRELTAGMSLSPLVQSSTLNRLDDGVTYSPLLQIGRIVTFDMVMTEPHEARPLDASPLWTEIFRGRITLIKWPDRLARKVTLTCSDFFGALQISKSEAEYVYTAGTSLEVAMQQMLDNNGYGSIILNVPVATGKVLSADYAPGLQKPVWEQIWASAQSVGWLVWGRYTDATTLALTLFSPERTKIIADLTIPVLYDFQDISVSEEEIRNAGYVVYTDENGERQMIGPVDNAASIATYGNIRRPFWINLEPDSPVRSTADASALLDDALADVADPDVLAVALVPPMPFVNSAVDLYIFPAGMGKHGTAGSAEFFDQDETLAPFASSLDFTAEEFPQTTLSLRGLPSAGSRTWSGRQTGQIPPIVTNNGISQTAAILSVEPIFNTSVASWKAWDCVGTSPKIAGVPDDSFAMTPANLREVSGAEWAVQDGLHHVLIRAFDSQGNFRDREETYNVTGIGGGGTGGGSPVAPTEIPGTPIWTVGDPDSIDTREVIGAWINTIDDVDIDGEWYVNGTSQGVVLSLGAGVTTLTDSFDIGSIAKLRVRYTRGFGYEGTWSPFSAQHLIPEPI